MSLKRFWIGFAKASCWRARMTFRALKSPVMPSHEAPGLPRPHACEKPAWRGGTRVWGSIRRDSRSAFGRESVITRCGVKRPDVSRSRYRGGGFSLVATLAKSSDRRVSGPSVERARLRGRGGSGSLYRRWSLLAAGLVVAAVVPRSKPTSAGAQRSTQNWHGPGESDCLIKTKHCDGQR